MLNSGAAENALCNCPAPPPGGVLRQLVRKLDSVCCVYDAQHRPIGVGIYIGHNCILTALHVVNAADPNQVRCHRRLTVGFARDQQQRASVEKVEYQPTMPVHRQYLPDWIVLRLHQQAGDLLRDLLPVNLLNTDNLWNACCGPGCQAVIVLPRSDPVNVVISDKGQMAHAITPKQSLQSGDSGAPVFNNHGELIGLYRGETGVWLFGVTNPGCDERLLDFLAQRPRTLNTRRHTSMSPQGFDLSAAIMDALMVDRILEFKATVELDPKTCDFEALERFLWSQDARLSDGLDAGERCLDALLDLLVYVTSSTRGYFRNCAEWTKVCWAARTLAMTVCYRLGGPTHCPAPQVASLSEIMLAISYDGLKYLRSAELLQYGGSALSLFLANEVAAWRFRTLEAAATDQFEVEHAAEYLEKLLIVRSDESSPAEKEEAHRSICQDLGMSLYD